MRRSVFFGAVDALTCVIEKVPVFIFRLFIVRLAAESYFRTSEKIKIII
jgi:hypothetical protein